MVCMSLCDFLNMLGMRFFDMLIMFYKKFALLSKK